MRSNSQPNNTILNSTLIAEPISTTTSNTDTLLCPLTVQVSNVQELPEIQRDLLNTNKIAGSTLFAVFRKIKENIPRSNTIIISPDKKCSITNHLNQRLPLTGNRYFVVTKDNQLNQLNMVIDSCGHFYLPLINKSILKQLGKYAILKKTAEVQKIVELISAYQIGQSVDDKDQKILTDIQKYLTPEEIQNVAKNKNAILAQLFPSGTTAINSQFILNIFPSLAKVINFTLADFNAIAAEKLKANPVVAAGELYFDKNNHLFEVNAASGTYPNTMHAHFLNIVTSFRFIEPQQVVQYTDSRKILTWTSKIIENNPTLTNRTNISNPLSITEKIEIRKQVCEKQKVVRTVSQLDAQRNIQQRFGVFKLPSTTTTVQPTVDAAFGRTTLSKKQ